MGTRVNGDRLNDSSQHPLPAETSLQRSAARLLARTLEDQLTPAEAKLVRLVRGQVDAPTHLTVIDGEAAALAARLGLLGCWAKIAGYNRDAADGANWLEGWSAAARAQTAFNLLLAHAEQEWLARLLAQGIEAIPLKGVSLSRILYGDVSARSTTDVDLLVRSKQVAVAARLLEAEGFRSSLPRELLSFPAFLRSTDEHTSESVYAAECAGVSLQIELHWKILPLPEREVWGALRTYDAPGGAVRGLSAELYLLYLCAHFAGHGWKSLHWLRDIAEFVKKFANELEPATFLGWCRRAALRHRTGVTFALLEAYCGVRWPAVESLCDARAFHTAAQLLRRPLQPASDPGVFAAHRERLRHQDGPAGRLRYLAWLARPTRAEWARPDGSLRGAPVAWMARAARLLRLTAAESFSQLPPAGASVETAAPLRTPAERGSAD